MRTILTIVAVLAFMPAMAQQTVPTTREPPPTESAPAGQGEVGGPAVVRPLPVRPVPGVAIEDGVATVFGPPLAPMDASPGISINERIDRAFSTFGE